ncbi:GNAT family N-acetyltransferase [Ornithinimicrobium pratense]|uniref:N-acetyltransferase n=1 Tax=Ornithinimicrobium pratense TaxID=2593973 RepID=A0A5J6V989_9MICO|nr:GNAT family N-acetyltransferase [Ornithinimicrobium pratense]QFG69693.1 N-acetyltransferase [Ornithinimicrobium pratense]
MSEPQIVHHPDHKRWEAMVGEGQDARSVGFLSYEMRGDVMDMQHTVVDPAMRGHGLGGRLVEAGLQHARAEGLRVRPTCPFIPPYMAQHPEHLDLLEGAPKVGESDG